MIYEGKGFYFRMGDKVKIIDASFFGVSKHIGKTAVVRAVCFDGMLKLESSGANIGTYHHSSVKLIEGAPVKFKSGDKVKVIGPTFQGNVNFLGLDGVVMHVNVYDDYRIKFADDTSLSFPRSSLKLIENNTEKAHRELNKTIIKIDKEMIKHLKKSKRVQELTQKVGSSQITLAHAASDAQREALEGASVSHVISRSNDAIDAMRYGFENLGKILERPTLSDNVNDLFTEIKDIIVAKNENYGDSFSKQYQKYGMVSVEMRLNDKFMRLEQLVAGEKDKVGESIEDTLKDIIGYATLALIELESEK